MSAATVVVTPLAALSGADVFGLVICFAICVYLLYALLRGENL